jgi:hypothetical protein
VTFFEISGDKIMRSRWIFLGIATLCAGAFALRSAPNTRTSPRPNGTALTDRFEATSSNLGAIGSPRDSNITEVLEREERVRVAAPIQEPAIEPQDILNTMTSDELNADISHIEQELERHDSIRRLNEGRVSPEERPELGAMLQRLAFMKHQVAKNALHKIEEELAEYQKGHAARVAAFVQKKK